MTLHTFHEFITVTYVVLLHVSKYIILGCASHKHHKPKLIVEPLSPIGKRSLDWSTAAFYKMFFFFFFFTIIAKLHISTFKIEEGIIFVLIILTFIILCTQIIFKLPSMFHTTFFPLQGQWSLYPASRVTGGGQSEWMASPSKGLHIFTPMESHETHVDTGRTYCMYTEMLPGSAGTNPP